MAYVARAPGWLRLRERKTYLEQVKQEVSGRKAGESHLEWSPGNLEWCNNWQKLYRDLFSLLLSIVGLATY